MNTESSEPSRTFVDENCGHKPKKPCYGSSSEESSSEEQSGKKRRKERRRSNKTKVNPIKISRV